MKVYLGERFVEQGKTKHGVPIVESFATLVVEAQTKEEGRKLRKIATSFGYLKHVEQLICQAFEEIERQEGAR